MAGQTTVRLGEDLTGADGTLIRQLVNPDLIRVIMRQVNVIGALFGNDKIRTKKGVEVPSRPKVLRTKKVNNYEIECFTNEPNSMNWTITTGTTGSGTTLTVSSGYSDISVNMLCQVAETRDEVLVTANSTGSLTIERVSGANAIDAGMHLIPLGLSAGESSTNPGFFIRDDDKHYTYTVELHAAWSVSQREMNIGEKGRYGGSSWAREQNRQLINILAHMEHMVIGAKRSSGTTATSATLPRGLESWAEDGNGSTFDFGGTIETSEIRELGDVACEYMTSARPICLTSHRVISAFQSALDDKLRLSPSELKEKSGMPDAKAFDVGPKTMEFLPCNFYAQSGKEGQGIIIDPKAVIIAYLNDLEMKMTKPFSDSTQASRQYGEWYSDHCGVIDELGGKGITFFTGANTIS